MTGWVMSEHGIPDSRLTVIKRDTKINAKALPCGYVNVHAEVQKM